MDIEMRGSSPLLFAKNRPNNFMNCGDFCPLCKIQKWAFTLLRCF